MIESTKKSAATHSHNQPPLFPLRLDTPTIRQSTHSSAITSLSGILYVNRCNTRPSPYEALQIHIALSGRYGFRSNNNMISGGFLYQGTFDPTDLSLNKVASDLASCLNGQFRLQAFLLTNTTYILVLSAILRDTRGPFSILTVGEGNASFTRLSELDSCPVFI